MAETGQVAAADREEARKVFSMRLKVIDRESGEVRVSTVEEARTWDWSNPEVWRIINGWQITSFKGLLSMLHRRAEKGDEEVEILEAPRFTMLSGG